jgi:hypothetical protein
MSVSFAWVFWSDQIAHYVVSIRETYVLLTVNKVTKRAGIRMMQEQDYDELTLEQKHPNMARMSPAMQRMMRSIDRDNLPRVTQLLEIHLDEYLATKKGVLLFERVLDKVFADLRNERAAR